MKFCFCVTGSSINGADNVLKHIGCALKELGHEIETVNIIHDIPECDAVWFQSQWYGILEKKLRSSKSKKICWLEHFLPSENFVPIETIKADCFNTQYKGDVKDLAEKRIGKDIYYLPHAACPHCMREGVYNDSYPKKVIIMNRNKFKDESWLDEAGVTILPLSAFKVSDAYRSANVVANIHAIFQKGISSEYLGAIGMGLNERVFQAIMSGGFVVNDNNPILRDFFSKEEVPMASTKEEFSNLVNYFNNNPNERLPYMQRAKERIANEHLYVHRIKQYGDFNNWWNG